MRHTAAYTEIIAPRWGKEESEYTLAKRTPKYIYGASGNSCLIHKVREVRLRWWTCGPNGSYLVRLQNPRMLAECMCGMSFRIEPGASVACELPKPDAVLCGRCHGEGTNFPQGREHKVPKRLARVRLGCIAKGSAA